MSRGASLQRRLGFGLAFGVMAMWIMAAVAAGLVIREEFDEAFDSALEEAAQRLLPLAVLDVMERQDPSATPRIAPLGAHDELLTYLVRDRAGNLLLKSHDVDPAIFPARPAVGFRQTPSHRIYGEAAVSGTIVIEVAEPLEHRREATLEAVAALALPLVFLVPVSILGVWWIVGRSMRPLRAFAAGIEARGAGDLSPVASAALPAEIAPIAGSVNRLLDRLRRVLEAERSFSANSAHELRTPVAAALAQTQRLIAEAEGAEVEGAALRHRALQIETALHRLSSLSEKLMQLARAEGGSLVSETPRDLAPVLVQIIEEARHAEGGSRLHLDGPAAGLVSHMDPDAFGILMRNLVENALKHSPPGTSVEILISDGAIRVVNEGPVIAPAELAALTGRFARGATSAGGSGLGLAIAGAVAAGAGATLDLASPAVGRSGGFEAALRLPP